MSEDTPVFGSPKDREAGASPVATSASSYPSANTALYQDSAQNPTTRLIMLGTIVVIAIMVVISLSLCIFRGVSTGQQGFLYFLVGASLIGFIAIQVILYKFLQSGDLAKGKTWFLYFTGFCTFVESILVAVIVMK